MSEALDLLAALPGWAVYALLAVGAAIENLVPPIPADTFVVVAGLLASRGVVDPWLAGFLTWAANVAGALLVYRMGDRYGRGFFEQGAGRYVLRPGQMRRIETFYVKWGTPAIFLARFLPGLRAVVPAFAGISHHGFWRTALPVAAASAIWYGGLVWAGQVAGRNLEAVEAWLGDTQRLLLLVALLLAGIVGVWWWRTRHETDGEGADEGRGP
jgi:membrane protein DedA with SNARE-associated domain